MSCSLLSMLPAAKAPAKGKLPSRDYDQKLQNQFVEAISNGDYPQVNRMLKFRPKISVNGLDYKNDSPLGVAALKGDRKIAGLLLDNGADVNTHAQGGISEGHSKPLIFAIVTKGDADMAELLLGYGAKLEYSYKAGLITKTIKLIDFVPNNHPNTQRLKELVQGKTKIL